LIAVGEFAGGMDAMTHFKGREAKTLDDHSEINNNVKN